MLKDLPLKSILSILMLCMVNAMFSYKYLSRETDLAIAITIALVIIQAIGFFKLQSITIAQGFHKLFAGIGILGLLGLVIFAHFHIDLMSLNVDRWSVIDSFWSASFNGEYPYLASSHMGNPPGSMPIYFVLSLPFWLLGELSVFSCIGYVILILMLVYKPSFKARRNAIWLYLATAVFLVWELLVRSNIITNTMLIILALDWFLRTDVKDLKKSWLVAVVLGLFLATRGNFAVVYIIFFMYPLVTKQVNFVQMFKFTALSALAFASVYLLLIGIYGTVFFEANPFIFHSTLFVPTGYIIAFFVLAFIFSVVSKSKADLYFYSGLTLFSIILLYAINLIIVYGFDAAYISRSWIDISYFLFCVPFLIFYLLKSPKSKSL